ncbi:hypothetical protein D3C85_118420 [compost metagenome]
MRARRMQARLASEAEVVRFQYGRPKRRDSSSPTQAASSVGSISELPTRACRVSASTTAGWPWPHMPPVSPRQKSA